MVITYENAVAAQVSSLQPEKCLEKKHSAHEGGNDAISSAHEFCARLYRVIVFIIPLKTATGNQDANSGEKEEAGSYSKKMQGAVIPIINSCAKFVLVAVLEK